MRSASWVMVATLGPLLVGCGGDAEPSKGSAGNGGALSNGGGATSGGGGGGGGAAGAVTSGGGGSAIGGGASPASCTGAFNAAEPVLRAPMDTSVNGVSLTADELELYYTRDFEVTATPTPEVVRRKRASKDALFGEAESLPELAGVCGDKLRIYPDVSEDGLTLYVTCTTRVDEGSEGVSVLRVARRAGRSEPFVLAAEPAGNVFAAAGIAADELTAYTDGEVFDTAPQMFTRSSKAEPFMGPMAVPGIDVPFRSPDVSSDGLTLFGAAGRDIIHIYRAHRADANAAFSTPEPIDLKLSEATIGAPNITAGCALYVVVVTSEGYTVQRALMQ